MEKYSMRIHIFTCGKSKMAATAEPMIKYLLLITLE